MRSETDCDMIVMNYDVILDAGCLTVRVRVRLMLGLTEEKNSYSG